MFVELCETSLDDERKTASGASRQVHGNWESVVMGPSCDRGLRGFQHTLAVHLVEVPAGAL